MLQLLHFSTHEPQISTVLFLKMHSNVRKKSQGMNSSARQFYFEVHNFNNTRPESLMKTKKFKLHRPVIGGHDQKWQSHNSGLVCTVHHAASWKHITSRRTSEEEIRSVYWDRKLYRSTETGNWTSLLGMTFRRAEANKQGNYIYHIKIQSNVFSYFVHSVHCSSALYSSMSL